MLGLHGTMSQEKISTHTQVSKQTNLHHTDLRVISLTIKQKLHLHWLTRLKVRKHSGKSQN